MKRLILVMALAAVPMSISCSVAGVATSEETIQMRTLQEQETAMLARIAAGETAPEGQSALVDQLAEIVRERADLDRNVAERAVGGVLGWLDGFIPVPMQPFKEVLTGLGAMLLFKRPRRHLTAGLKSLGKLDGKAAAASVLKTFGLAHSNTDPIEVMRGAAAAARASGDEALAERIEMTIIDMEAGVGTSASSLSGGSPLPTV